MQAAFVEKSGQAPVLRSSTPPTASTGEHLIQVSAAALSPITRSRASGAHYSASGTEPLGLGIDGVGRDDQGRRVYFVLPRSPFGSLATQTVVAADHCLPLPDDLDDVTAAALANPGMSSWAALTERARLTRGETVLVNGATGAAGRLAVQIAKHLGAAKVIATGRDPAALRDLAALGADVIVPLGGPAEALEAAVTEQFAAGVDVVLDYLWGASAQALLIAAAKASAEAVPIRFVHIGAASGGDIRLPGAVLRASALTLMGSGIGSIPGPALIRAIAGVLAAAGPAGLRIATRPMPFSAITQAWDAAPGPERIVFTMAASA